MDEGFHAPAMKPGRFFIGLDVMSDHSIRPAQTRDITAIALHEAVGRLSPRR
jgi:hypothetical protein